MPPHSLLWRHVAGCSNHCSCFCRHCGDSLRSRIAATDPSLDEFCQSKIENFQITIRTQHYVLGLYVAMCDACLVCGRQGARYLPCQIESLGQIHLSICHPLSQCTAFDILRRDEVRAFYLLDIENSKDVRMIECRRCASLLLEASYPVLILGETGGK